MPGKVGKETTVITDDGKEIRVRYRLVSTKNVIASHTFENNQAIVNDKYPAELQPRDRGRGTMTLEVNKMANSLRPEDLADSRNLNQGAPVIRSDGVVLNGNGRTMAISTAQSRHNDAAKAYRKYLTENAAKFGFTAKDVKNTPNVLLVREVIDDDADIDAITESTTGGSRMGAAEQAKSDAKKIKASDLDNYFENEKGDLTLAQNRGFVGQILRRIIPQNEMNAYTDAKGGANADAIQRVRRALFALA